MSHNLFELKSGALFISDAHYSAHRPKLLHLLESILSGEIPASQLILMGDIFDLLFGGISLTYQRNSTVIDIINSISKKMQILYLEGNHDFNIKKYFPNIQIVPLSSQPLHVRYKNTNVLLAHGDFGSELKYRIYTSMIRSQFLLSFIGLIDLLTFHSIIHWLDGYLAKKNDCYKISDFEALVKKRIDENELLQYDVLVEGHFHQNRSFSFENFEYINLGAFACNERYFVVKSEHEALRLEELFL